MEIRTCIKNMDIKIVMAIVNAHENFELVNSKDDKITFDYLGRNRNEMPIWSVKLSDDTPLRMPESEIVRMFKATLKV